MIPPDLYTYRLLVEYDGTKFYGWQLQAIDRTVQGEIETAAERLFLHKVRIIGAGRTDAGVHATGQVAHFRSTVFREVEIVKKALNNFLPNDIVIKQVAIENNDFHARFSAKWRSYCYTIHKSEVAIGRNYGWVHEYPLGLNEIQTASNLILGVRCFKSFAHPTPKELHYLSSVYKTAWYETDNTYKFEVVANRFLHGMIRLLVGTLVEVGKGKLTKEQFREILASEDVKMAGTKAPASGLCLTAVGYRDWPEL